MTEKNSNPFAKEDTDLKSNSSENSGDKEFSFFDDVVLNAVATKDENISSNDTAFADAPIAGFDQNQDQDNSHEDDFFSFEDPSENGQDIFSNTSIDDVFKPDDSSDKESPPQSSITEDDFSFFDSLPESSSDVFGDTSNEILSQPDVSDETGKDIQSSIDADDFSFFDPPPASSTDVFSDASNEDVLPADITDENEKTSQSGLDEDFLSFFAAPPPSSANLQNEIPNSGFPVMETLPIDSNKEIESQENVAIPFEDESSIEQPSITVNETSVDLNVSAEAPLPLIPKSDKMRFACHKCSTANEIDFALLMGDSYNFNCNSCNTGNNIVKESSILRAIQKSHEIFCVRCGNRIDYHINCPSCGLFCPDYYLLETSSDIKRKSKAKKSVDISNTIAGIKSFMDRRRSSAKKSFAAK